MNFDYVIIGAGSAGCVLANRLSENGKYTVCIIEAGEGGRSALVNTPGAFAAFMFTKKFNWRFNAKSYADIRNGEPFFVPRGKGLGGSSSINAMLYIRGQQQDYDHWQSLGNHGWSFDNMLPYFKKSETNSRGASAYHGDSGPLQVTDRPINYPLSKVFVKAGQQAGFKYTDDFNNENQEGFGYFQCTIKDGQRSGAAKCYLKPAMTRENLKVIVQAYVSKIIFEGQHAVAVEYEHRGKLTTVRANKEIILSAGAIQSPQVLMLSGIGDQFELQKHGITCIKHLPGVGKNLQEHVDSCVLVKSKKSDGFTASVTGILKMLPDTLSYLFNKKGKLANSILEVGAFIKSDEKEARPDIQLHMLPLLFDDNGRDLKLMSQHGYSCHVCVLRPKSTGTISLRTAHFKQAPEIDFNFFSDPEGQDRKVLIDGIKQARKILACSALDDYRSEEIHPGINAQSDEDIFIKAKQRLGAVYHPVGTCKMGVDNMAVVDPTLKVHGIKGLRVVDASIMPTIVSGNTNAPTIAIAEKASDLILNDA